MSAESDSALLSGLLRVEGGCLYVETGDGTRILPAFMTDKTQWRVDWEALWVGDRAFRAGDRVELGGSMLSTPPTSLEWRQAPAPGCDTSRIWVAGSIQAAS